MASIPTGAEERGAWEAKSAAWERQQAKDEHEARMLEKYPALTALYLALQESEGKHVTGDHSG